MFVYKEDKFDNRKPGGFFNFWGWEMFSEGLESNAISISSTLAIMTASKYKN